MNSFGFWTNHVFLFSLPKTRRVCTFTKRGIEPPSALFDFHIHQKGNRTPVCIVRFVRRCFRKNQPREGPCPGTVVAIFCSSTGGSSACAGHVWVISCVCSASRQPHSPRKHDRARYSLQFRLNQRTANVLPVAFSRGGAVRAVSD